MSYNLFENCVLNCIATKNSSDQMKNLTLGRSGPELVTNRNNEIKASLNKILAIDNLANYGIKSVAKSGVNYVSTSLKSGYDAAKGAYTKAKLDAATPDPVPRPAQLGVKGSLKGIANFVMGKPEPSLFPKPPQKPVTPPAATPPAKKKLFGIFGGKTYKKKSKKNKTKKSNTKKIHKK
jgi:hypothetical protein